jgi:simple sugar transport system ATP-binding protein
LIAVAPRPAPPSLEVEGLTKRFGTFTALEDASLRLAPAQFHALLGENGAGKSTLVKCVMGYHRADAGSIRLDGAEVTPRNPREAQMLGIGMVYQHFTVVPNLTVAENLVLSRPKLPAVLDWQAERDQLDRFFERVPFRLPLDAAVRTLAAGERQKLEIVKQLYLGSRVVILDEPTSVLTPQEADEALGLLHELTRARQISVLIITHKFREVTRFCDEVTVLRRGRRVGGGRVADLTPAAMAELMVGARAPASVETVAERKPVGAPRLRVTELSALDDRGTPALTDVSFDVRAGEIVGIAAVAGNGQEELVEVLGGQRRSSGGAVLVEGLVYEGSRAEIAGRGFRCLPEEPLRNACVGDMTVAENIAFATFDRPPIGRRGWLSRRAMASLAARLIAAFGVRTPSPQTPIERLSGGNVQRAVLARELADPVSVLVVANPCMGLDFGAVAEIHGRLRRARDQGAAVLLVSADLDEVLALADRVLVMSDGRIVHETAIADAEVAVIGQHMAGHGRAAA